MTNWFEPQNLHDWSRRVFALRPVLMALLVGCIIILEMRFDWVERTLGAYLVTTNSARPQSGAIWEKGRQTLTAQKTLEKIVTDRLASQREARSAETFAQIAAGLSAGQGAMLSAENFRDLYLKLPREAAREVISALELLKISAQGNWRRTYFEKSGRDLIVYLLDADNRVLRRIDIPADGLMQLEREDIPTVEALEDLANFKNRIYPAERFFEALVSLPDEIRRNVILNPETLLKPAGQIVQVGISDEAVSGYIELGFEFAMGAGRQVIVVQGHEWAVWRLRTYLEEKGTTVNPIKDYQKDRTPR
ncbi:MAG: hypothetical protein JSW26_10790 [Desulfobacterales bacterium]|nr:MAG: hypothetical protein JSW26_10790 [Desulfobacterales bacterium]